jgi:uncharacterized protein involved in exopolysaccharide biosynthesis
MGSPYRRPSRLHILRRVNSRWKPPVAVFLVMFGLVVLLAVMLPNQYQSSLKLLVRNERMNPIVSVDQQTQGILYVDDVSESRINTEIELLTSDDVLRQVVATCHLDQFVSSSKSQRTRQDLALKKLEKDLTVSVAHKSNIIEATYASKDPQRSAAVMRSLSNAYMASHQRLQGSPDSFNFFRTTYEKYSSDLHDAEAKLAAFRQTHHMVAVPEQESMVLEHVTGIEKSLGESSAAVSKAAQESAKLEQVMKATPATIESERRSLPNQAEMEQLGTLLITLQNKRIEAVQRYRPDDRIVQELDAQIGQTEAALNAANTHSAQEVATGANPTLLSAQSEYIKASTEVAGDSAQTRELSDQLRANRAILYSLDAQTEPYSDLDRQVKHLQDLTEFYKKKSDEAQVNDLLDAQGISNVTVAEAPTVSTLPSSPNRSLIVALGFVWSLLIAGATGFGMNLMNEEIATPFELEQVAGLPLLAAIPAHALAPSCGGAFPAVYMSMQRSDRKWSVL